ncbi:hypothetical protein WN943_009085 [Citrus x changshan-huyou]
MAMGTARSRGYLRAKDFKHWLENNYKLQDSGPFTIAGGD